MKCVLLMVAFSNSIDDEGGDLGLFVGVINQLSPVYNESNLRKQQMTIITGDNHASKDFTDHKCKSLYIILRRQHKIKAMYEDITVQIFN
jgi:hypothetical protein